MRCRNFSIAYGILKEKNVPISSTVTPPVRSFLPWTGTKIETKNRGTESTGRCLCAS